MRVFRPAALRTRTYVLHVLLLLLLSLLPLHTLSAAPLAQDAPLPLLLGEFGRATMAAEDAVQYALAVPIDGVYTVAYTGEGDPADFILTVADAAGSILSDAELQGETMLELTAGDYVLTFTAQTAADLAFLVGIEAGSMTTDADAPGELFNGSVYVTEQVTEALYATVEVAASPYPQQVLVLVQGGDGDLYQVEVTSEAYDYYSTSTDVSDVLQFVSTGGAYQLVVTPVEGGDTLQVSVFLSGPAPVLAWDVETTEALDGPTDTDTYQITVEEAGTVVALTATDDSEGALTVAAGFLPEQATWSNYNYGDEAVVLEFVAPEAGVYYVTLSSDSEAGANYTVVAEARGAAAFLSLDEPMRDSIAGGGTANYLLEVTEADQFVVVVLAGPVDEDLDLTIARYAEGEQVASDSSAGLSSREVVGLFSEEPGVYIVTVNGAWAGDADFALLASTGALVDLLGDVPTDADATPAADGSLAQWAVDAVASSEYTDDGWSARQATGAADTPEAGDVSSAWAAASADVQTETLTLTYAQAVTPVGIEIYETYNPGAVARIEVLDPNTDEWIVVWEGTSDTAGEELAVFSPTLAVVDFATDQVRLTIDEPLIAGWNEIDAVKLIGMPE